MVISREVHVKSPAVHVTSIPTGPDLPNQPDMTGPENDGARAPAVAPGGAVTFLAVVQAAEARLTRGENPVSVVGQTFGQVYGVEVGYARLGRVLKEYDAPFELIRLMIEIFPRWNQKDNPLSYLQGAIRRRKNGQRNGSGAAVVNDKLITAPTPTAPSEPEEYERTPEEIAAEQRERRAFQDELARKNREKFNKTLGLG